MVLREYGDSGNGVAFVDNENVNKFNISGWSNAEYDTLIDEAFKATDSSVRAEKLRAAEAILVEESPIIPVKFNVSFAFVGKKLSDVEFNRYGALVLTEADLDDYHEYLPKTEEEEQ